MLPLDPQPAAVKAIQLLRKDQPIPVDEGVLGDIEREALEEGLPQWVAAKCGFLYLAANASWPGLYKLGCTRRTVAARMAGLNNAGLATPWVAVCQWWVPDAHGFEALVHQACADSLVKGELYHAPVETLHDVVAKVCADEFHLWRKHLIPLLGLETVESLLTPSPPATRHSLTTYPRCQKRPS